MLTMGTPKVVTAQRFLGVTGVYWGHSLRSLTGVRESAKGDGDSEGGHGATRLRVIKGC